MSDVDRGRIPFALVGVLLLTSSAVIAATDRPTRRPAEPAVSKALDRATAQTQTALRRATLDASRAAGRNPVVVPANTSAGRALNETDPFRDALRLRIYLAVADRLGRIDRRRGDVRVTSSLPPITNASDLRGATERVTIARADPNGTSLRVSVENVTLTARRRGRVLTTRRVSPTLVVGTPVLALHDRVTAYQRRLDAGVTEPGLDRRLTAQLYALAWGRGYAQYGGAPIENVVANRHVGVATNAALLDLQRSTIGTSDGDGRRTLAVATARAAGRDLLAANGGGPPAVPGGFEAATAPPPNGIRGLEPPEGPRRRDDMHVGVNRTADEAFLSVLENGALNGSLASAYSVEARYLTRIRRLGGGRPAPPSAPSGDWTRVDESSTRSASASESDPRPPAAPDGWHRFATYGRDVTLHRTRTRTWQRGNETTTTSTHASETIRVVVAVVGRHDSSDVAPPNPLSNPHEAGVGPLSGPNLADARNRTLRRLVARRGGPDMLAVRAATGTLEPGTFRIETDRPPGLYRWVYRDLMALRERVRNVTATVERGRVGTFQASPQAALAARLRERRDDLVDAPATYDSAATKARVAARAAYVDAVVERLESRAADRESRAGRFDAALRERDAGSLGEVRAGASATDGPSPPRQSRLSGPAGPVRLRVDSAPSYLTLAEIDGDRVPALDGPGTPLVARNVNVFTIPYGDAADAVVGNLFDGGRVRLATAARTLRATNETLDRRSNATARARRDELSSSVARATRYVAGQVRYELAIRGVGDGAAERRRIVDSGLARWDTRAARAIALANGSAGRAIAAAADDRVGLAPTTRDRLRLELDARIRRALERDRARPRAATVNTSRRATREVARRVTERIAANLTDAAFQRVANESFDRTPSGLPLAPPASGWYVTTNVWHVTVRGEYARFGVRVNRGRPTAPGSGLTYVRDGEPVTLDVDADGSPERLGRAARVDFDVSTTVVVVVPPGKSGVGDRGGDADERSGGWPEPGPG